MKNNKNYTSSITFLFSTLAVIFTFIIDISPLLDPFTKISTIFIAFSIYGFTPWFLHYVLSGGIKDINIEELAYKLYMYNFSLTFYSSIFSIFIFVIISLIIATMYSSNTGLLLPLIILSIMVLPIIGVLFWNLIRRIKLLVHKMNKDIKEYVEQVTNKEVKEILERIVTLFSFTHVLSIIVLILVVSSSYFHYLSLLMFNPNKSSLAHIEGGELYFVVLIKHTTDISTNTIIFAYYLAELISLLSATILQILSLYLIIEVSQIILEKLITPHKTHKDNGGAKQRGRAAR